jgi:monooxygenase
MSYAILEARASLGGTWDLFRYPGIRSDSDMYTLGYSFHPWQDAKAIADGPAILQYIRDTSRKYGIDLHIRFQHRALRAAWDSPSASWTVEMEVGAAREPKLFTCRFLYLCAGYYDYASGYTPEFPGRERFGGRIVHPQHWPDDFDYAGQRIIVIGSGATAVTLVPELAKTAAHVTMLQRSPTYVISMPTQDKIANRLRRILPAKLAYTLARWKNVLQSMLFYQLSRRAPEHVKKLIQKGVRAQLGPTYDPRHFTPRYNPWDQRLCLVPDADFFHAIKAGKVSLITDRIDSFTPRGIRLQGGEELPADLIITATGLNLKLMGGLRLVVDGQEIDPPQCRVYKGMMLSGIPNLAFAMGYTNASWTLKADLTSRYVCRLLNYFQRRGFSHGTPRYQGGTAAPLIHFTSGYVQRALALLPQQGSRKPWKLHQNYALDLLALRFGSLTDSMQFFPIPASAHPSPATRTDFPK